MATIQNPRLIIAVDPAHGKSTMIVKCKLNFLPAEISRMQNGEQFRLDCAIYTTEGNYLVENRVFSYHSLYFPEQLPNEAEYVIFRTEMEIDPFEDMDFWESDEIHGKLTLNNLSTGVNVPAKTNVVVHEFVS